MEVKFMTTVYKKMKIYGMEEKISIKFSVDKANEYSMRYRFAVVIAKCLGGGGRFVDTVYYMTSAKSNTRLAEASVSR